MYISTVKCLMENSDLIARTSCGENSDENTITSIYRTIYTGIQAQSVRHIHIGTHCTHVSASGTCTFTKKNWKEENRLQIWQVFLTQSFWRFYQVLIDDTFT